MPAKKSSSRPRNASKPASKSASKSSGPPPANKKPAGKPFPRGPGTPKLTPRDKKRALEVEKEFGKDIRRAAERSGRKPAVWREAEKREAREVVLNKIGSAAVQKATTRTWEEWLVTLDAEGMKDKEHRDVVGHLLKTHGLTSWWAQMVTVGYEQAHGRRLVHEKATGFEISVSRSLEASVSDVFRAFNDPARRGWCAIPDYVVRTTIAPRSLRLGMPDSTIVSVAIDRKGNTKCSVTVQHTKLADANTAEQAKAFWRDALASLADQLS